MYFVLIGLTGLFLAPGYTRTISTDPVLLTEGNANKKFLVITFFKLLRQPVFALLLILIGYISQSKYSVVGVIRGIVHVISLDIFKNLQAAETYFTNSFKICQSLGWDTLR